MTLLEVMIAGGISVLVSLGIAGVYIFAVKQFTILVGMNEAQENALWLAYHSKSLFSQAVDLENVSALTCNPAASLSISGGGNSGCVTNFVTSDTSNPRQVVVASFHREWADGVTQATSLLLPTIIFFDQPRADTAGPNGQGTIFFDINTTPGQLAEAQRDDIFYDRVVRYDTTITREQIGGTAPTDWQVTGVRIQLATRYHRGTGINQRWCLPGNAACNGGVAYSDIEMDFKVGLRNNRALELTGSQQPRSIHGGIYYYRFIPPLFLGN